MAGEPVEIRIDNKTRIWITRLLDRDFWNYKRVLVTGGTGFVGSWLCMTLKELGSEVSVISRSNGATGTLFGLSGLGSEVTLYSGDIRDKEFVRLSIEKSCPDVVFHLAAQPIALVAKERPFDTFETNILGTLNVIECAKNTGVPKVLVITSERWDGKQVENLDIYASSKACTEIMINSLGTLFENSNPDMDIIRMSNIIGGGDRELTRLVPYCIDCCIHNNHVVLNRPEAIMRFVYVMDVIVALLQIAQGRSKFQTYNVSDIFTEIEDMTVEHVRDIVIETYRHAVDEDGIHSKELSIFVKRIKGQEFQIVSTSAIDAIRDSVYIGKMMSLQSVRSAIIYSICKEIIRRYLFF